MADNAETGKAATGTEVDLVGMAGVGRRSHRSIAKYAAMATMATADTVLRIIDGTSGLKPSERRPIAEIRSPIGR